MKRLMTMVKTVGVGNLVLFILACAFDGSHTPEQNWQWLTTSQKEG